MNKAWKIRASQSCSPQKESWMQDVIDKSVQVLALTKFGSTIAAGLIFRRSGKRPYSLSRQCKVDQLGSSFMCFGYFISESRC